MSPFLKSGITDAVFHCVGNSDLESDKLNKRERGTHTVLHVFLSIRWLMESRPDAFPSFKICKISRTLLGVIWKKSSVAFVLRGKSGFDVIICYVFYHNDFDMFFLFVDENVLYLMFVYDLCSF